MSQKSLLDFLTALSMDAGSYEKYASDPGLAMSQAGLTPFEQKLVLSDDKQAIQEYLGEKEYLNAMLRTSLV